MEDRGWQVSGHGDSIWIGTSGDLFLSVDPQPVWRGFPVDGLYRYSRLFPVLGSLHCHWLFISSVTESQVSRGAADLFGVMLVFYITERSQIIAVNGGGILCYLDFLSSFAAWLVYNLTANLKIALAAGITVQAVNIIIFLL